MKYALFIGRWQNWHEGHRWLIDQAINKGKKVWVAIRNVRQRSKKNPKKAIQVFQELELELKDLVEGGKVIISIIPDIESIEYGRNVGYDVIEHTPPDDVRDISGTGIRKGVQ